MTARALASAVVLATVIAFTVAVPVSAAPERPVVPTAAFVADVHAGAAALKRLGGILQGVAGLEDLRAKARPARRALTRFDRRMYALSRYRLSDGPLERQRAALARTAPGVTAALSDFLDAALLGDADEVARLAPRVTARIRTFQRAATA